MIALNRRATRAFGKGLAVGAAIGVVLVAVAWTMGCNEIVGGPFSGEPIQSVDAGHEDAVSVPPSCTQLLACCDAFTGEALTICLADYATDNATTCTAAVANFCSPATADAGSGDAANSDAIISLVDAGCAGCWAGSICQSGTLPSACGTGGTTCGVCPYACGGPGVNGCSEGEEQAPTCINGRCDNSFQPVCCAAGSCTPTTGCE